MIERQPRKEGDVWSEIFEGQILLKTMQFGIEIVLHRPNGYTFLADEYQNQGFHHAAPLGDGADDPAKSWRVVK